MNLNKEDEKPENRLTKLKTPKVGDKCDICKKSLKQWWQDSFDDKKGHRSCLMKRLGRPQGNISKYKPEYCEMLIEYFSIAPYREVKTEIKGHTKDGGIYILKKLRLSLFLIPLLAL